MSSKPLILGSAPEDVNQAGDLIRAGAIVAFPTETVYGLGADATSDTAVARIFAAKGRPRFNPLIAHVANLEEAMHLGVFDKRARVLAETFWPGPLTLVLPRHKGCPVALLASAGLPAIAIRVPSHPLARALIREAARPIAAPSANRSGTASPTTAQHVLQSLSASIDAILVGGPAEIGLESTIIDLCDETPRLLRPGGLSRTALEDVLGPLDNGRTDGVVRAPGQLASHYAPNLPLRLNAASVSADEALLAFGSNIPLGAAAVLNLSASADLVEAAANLFAHLHALDRGPFTRIAVMTIPEQDLGEAINDRLRRAAAPRES